MMNSRRLSRGIVAQPRQAFVRAGIG